MASGSDQPPTRRIDRAAVLLRFYSAASADGTPRHDPEGRDREAELRAELERLEPGHPDRGLLLSLLGEAAKLRFVGSGKTSDLAQALELNKRGVAQAPADDPLRPRLLANMADARIKSFETSHDRNHLVLAVGALREALDLLPDRHAERVRVRSRLAVALATLGSLPGQADALREADELLAAVVDELPSTDPRRTGVLLLSAGVLQDRYFREFRRGDLERAVQVARQALADAHPYDLRIPQCRAKLQELQRVLAS